MLLTPTIPNVSRLIVRRASIGALQHVPVSLQICHVMEPANRHLFSTIISVFQTDPVYPAIFVVLLEPTFALFGQRV